MTPQELKMVASDAEALHDVAEHFQSEFYAVLFELDPALRDLFPSDMEEQRVKLFAELEVLVDSVIRIDDQTNERRFAEHARRLGRRHEVYGVTAPMYDTVKRALLAALRECLEGFDDRHADAWTKVYALVGNTMQDPDSDRSTV